MSGIVNSRQSKILAGRTRFGLDLAESTHPDTRNDGESNTAWTRAFSIAMDTLAKPLLNGAASG